MFVVCLCLRLSIQSSLPFRATSRAIEIFFSEIPELRNARIPSSKTVQRWAATVGYFKLQRPKIPANDWQVIIDLSIQIGTHKCLTILGCRRSDVKFGRPLTLQDLEVLEIRILSKVNGPAIKDALEAVCMKIGRIQVICSDEGSDVLAGIRLYQAEHPETIHIPDIAHKTANLLKHRLQDDPTWQALCTKASELKINVQQTEVAAIAPPAQRTKARFMNADILVKWAKVMLCLLDHPEEIADIEPCLFESHVGWLRGYRQAIEHYSRLVQITAIARNTVRTQGVCSAAVVQFETEAELLDLTTDECQFVGEVIDFLQAQASKTADIGSFIGSSEILESFFGKFKSMEGDQCKSGFTGLVLAAHAHVGKLDEDTIATALLSVKTKTLNGWIKTQVGTTVQSKRKRLFTWVSGFFKKQLEHESSGILEGDAVGF